MGSSEAQRHIDVVIAMECPNTIAAIHALRRITDGAIFAEVIIEAMRGRQEMVQIIIEKLQDPMALKQNPFTDGCEVIARVGFYIDIGERRRIEQGTCGRVRKIHQKTGSILVSFIDKLSGDWVSQENLSKLRVV